jgi:isopropylmalate/homocitrate/citramalate synthase
MLPRQVQARTRALREAGISVGFHGHDNLGLAAANSLAALDAGAALVDGTLRGIGRSAGNAQVEAVVKAGRQEGHFAGVDGDALCRLGAAHVAPHRPRDRGIDHLDLAMGEGRFHSEGLALAAEVARAHGLPLEELVREVGLRDPISPGRALMERTAEDLRQHGPAAMPACPSAAQGG